MKVLFVGAHPDDEMSCLGTLLLYRRRGDQIALVCATNGDKGMSDDPSFPLAECARIRDLEMREVAHELAAEYDCLGEPDEALFDTWENRLKMIEAVRRARPDVVFTHFSQDYNLDHTATSALVFQSTLLAQIASVTTQSPAIAKVPAIFYVDPGPGFGFEATHFVEIDEAAAREARRLMGYAQKPDGRLPAIARQGLPRFDRRAKESHWRASGRAPGRSVPPLPGQPANSPGQALAMKINDVEAIILESPYENRPPEGSEEAHGVKHCLLLRVSTDEGLVGWSDIETAPHVAAAAVTAPASGAGMFEGLRELVVGEDPFDVERLWDKIYRGTIYYGRRGVAMQLALGLRYRLPRPHG